MYLVFLIHFIIQSYLLFRRIHTQQYLYTSLFLYCGQFHSIHSVDYILNRRAPTWFKSKFMSEKYVNEDERVQWNVTNDSKLKRPYGISTLTRPQPATCHFNSTLFKYDKKNANMVKNGDWWKCRASVKWILTKQFRSTDSWNWNRINSTSFSTT